MQKITKNNNKMKKSVKFSIFFLIVIIVVLWAIFTTERKPEKENQPEPVQTEHQESQAPELPKDPKGEKLLLMNLPEQDTTVVFKLEAGDVVKMAEIRNESNAVLIWTSDSRNFYQIILRDKYPDWSPNVEGGCFRLKNGKKLSVKFE